jgi:hypothetical protein
MSRPRLAIVAPTLDILGGQGIQALALLEHLREDGYDVTFVPINPAFPAALRVVRRLPYARTALNQMLYLPALRALSRVDVVHVFSASPVVLAPAPAIVARMLGKRIALNYQREADEHLTRWSVAVHPWLWMVDEIVVLSGYLWRSSPVTGTRRASSETSWTSRASCIATVTRCGHASCPRGIWSATIVWTGRWRPSRWSRPAIRTRRS